VTNCCPVVLFDYNDIVTCTAEAWLAKIQIQVTLSAQVDNIQVEYRKEADIKDIPPALNNLLRLILQAIITALFNNNTMLLPE
jgi:hypothetical protein